MRPPVAILSPPRLVVVVAWVPTAQVASLRLWVTPGLESPGHTGAFSLGRKRETASSCLDAVSVALGVPDGANRPPPRVVVGASGGIESNSEGLNLV